MERELTKEELEAQIKYKERRLGHDLEEASSEVRERLGFHLKVTLPVTVGVLTSGGLLARGVAVRRARARQLEEAGLRVPLAAVLNAVRRVKPRALIYGALLFGAGALLGGRRRGQASGGRARAYAGARPFIAGPAPRPVGDTRYVRAA